MEGPDPVGSMGSPDPVGDRWGVQVSEQLEELGWTAGLLRTLGERIARAETAEARAFGQNLIKHADTLSRLKDGALAFTARVMEADASLGEGPSARGQVLDALRKCGTAMVAAASGYTVTARQIHGLGGELKTAMGEAMIIARLVEERGKQMSRLAQKLRTEGTTRTAGLPVSSG